MRPCPLLEFQFEFRDECFFNINVLHVWVFIAFSAVREHVNNHNDFFVAGMGSTLMSLNMKIALDQHFPQKPMLSQQRCGPNMLKGGQCGSSILKDGAILFSYFFLPSKGTGDLWQAVMPILLLLTLKDLAHILMTLKLLLYKPKERSVGSCTRQEQLLKSSRDFLALILRKVKLESPFWTWSWRLEIYCEFLLSSI